MTSKLQRLEPVLPVADVRAAIAFYERLGFCGSRFEDGDVAEPPYGFVSRDGIHVHLKRTAPLDRTASRAALYLYVDNVDGLHREWREAGDGADLTGPRDAPYGLREFTLVDPWGNAWRVGSELA
ncbi:MAG: bleomycin resistance protein [Sandaracinaceae bacterium]